MNNIGNEDEVQFLYETAQPSIACQICSQDLTKLSVVDRNIHYDKHFNDQPQAIPQPMAGPSRTTNVSKAVDKVKSVIRNPKRFVEKDGLWHPAKGPSPPDNCTPGFIPLLKKSLIRSHARGWTQKAYLCHESAVLMKVESWDRGWGCGYRNFLMACASLCTQQQQPVYFALLEEPIPPGVRNLQRWIESAWDLGFDEEGASQLNHKLIGTSKWIGTAELFVAFISRGIPCNLVDFSLGKSNIEPLIDWIVKYFSEGIQQTAKQSTVTQALSGASPIIVTEKLPIVLQHAGHSRTVVGFERGAKGQINLLMFDPSSKFIPHEIRNAALKLAGFAQSTPTQPPSNFFNQVRQQANHIRYDKKRKSPDEPRYDQAKRPKGSGPHDAIVIDDDDETPQASKPVTVRGKNENEVDNLNPTNILKLFRVSAKSLSRKDKYQILYFPLTDPLTDSQRLSRRVVTSQKIC
ncbi:peptidase family C78-domain-containing protein [Abortiporus biennis]|nr:peptidase family C78-domain-containing protein [Abortiporus biennis]